MHVRRDRPPPRPIALRNEYGVIPGVRVAADERTSRVIVQAPPEVQSRISQRLAAAFPDLQPAAEKPRQAGRGSPNSSEADSGRPARDGIMEHAGESA